MAEDEVQPIEVDWPNEWKAIKSNPYLKRVAEALLVVRRQQLAALVSSQNGDLHAIGMQRGYVLCTYHVLNQMVITLEEMEDERRAKSGKS